MLTAFRLTHTPMLSTSDFPPYGGKSKIDNLRVCVKQGERPQSLLLSLLLSFLLSLSASAQSFDRYFEDATLRLDYIFAGNDHEQHIYLENVKRQEKWAGRRARLAEKFLKSFEGLLEQARQII